MSARAVVVGVDGSEPSQQAVRWAAREAGARNARLVLVHAFDTERLRTSAGAEMWIDEVEASIAAESTAMLDRAMAEVERVDSGVAMETRWDRADPAEALCAASRDAALVVLGWTGRGVLGTALGSVTLAVASHAECPVVVVRGETFRDGGTRPVLVGVDGGPLSDVALAHAFDAAALHHDPLVALHTWTDADTRRAHLSTLFEASPWQTMREEEERALAERLAGWRERHPDVAVEPVLEQADPRKALAERSTHARLVVVATRGRGGFTGLLLGSTGLALIQHAGCPVMLVGPDAASP